MTLKDISPETIAVDEEIRYFLKQHNLFDKVEELCSTATLPNLKGPVPEVRVSCPICNKGALIICKGTHGHYLYCCCTAAKGDEDKEPECDLRII